MDVILGAGLSGLSAAYHFNSNEYVLLEKENNVGGLCRSICTNDFIFDMAGHFLHVKERYTKELILKLFRNDIKTHKRISGIYFSGSIIPYPFQLNLYWLDDEKKKECLSGVIKSQYEFNNLSPNNFDEWIMKYLGEGIRKYFMYPYNRKLWCVDPSELTIDWVNDFVPQPSLDEIIEGAIIDKPYLGGYNPTFYYPISGGIDKIGNVFLPFIEKNLKLNVSIKNIDIEKKKIITTVETYNYENLISTIPLPELINYILNIPDNIKEFSNKLRYTSLKLVCIGLNQNIELPHHWIYFPENDKIFYRICIFSNVSKNMAPKGGSSLCAEISYINKIKYTDEELIYNTIKILKKIGFITDANSVVKTFVINIKYAYVIYDAYRKQYLNEILNYLEKNNIFTIGRYGKWNYSTMESAILDGRNIVKKIGNIPRKHEYKL